MGIISWLILGGISGWVASIIAGKNDSMGAVQNIIVGIAGAFIGGFIMNFFGGDGVTGFNIKSLFVAILGSWVLLFIIGKIKGSK